MKRIIHSILIALFAFSPVMAYAQAKEPDDMATKNLMALARQNITKARMSDGNFVPAETPEQLQKPVVPLVTGKRVIRIASNAATAAWCNVEWKESYFHPFMKGEIEKKTWTEKQIAYISLLNGMTMSAIIKGTESLKRKCSPEDAEKIKKVIAEQDFK